MQSPTQTNLIVEEEVQNFAWSADEGAFMHRYFLFLESLWAKGHVWDFVAFMEDYLFKLTAHLGQKGTEKHQTTLDIMENFKIIAEWIGEHCTFEFYPLNASKVGFYFEYVLKEGFQGLHIILNVIQKSWSQKSDLYTKIHDSIWEHLENLDWVPDTPEEYEKKGV